MVKKTVFSDLRDNDYNASQTFLPDHRVRPRFSEGVEKLKTNKKRPNPTWVGRLENFRAKPY